MRFFALVLIGLLALPFQAQAEMTAAFDWGRLPRCTTGTPYAVKSPKFVISDVPAEATHLELRMVDLDAPYFNHGTQRFELVQQGNITLDAGLFYYKGPCPKNAVHTYEWRIKALKGRKVIAETQVRRNYPD